MSSAGGVPPCRPLDVRPDPRWPSEWVTVACVTPWPYLAIQYQARGTHAAAAAEAAARGGSVWEREREGCRRKRVLKQRITKCTFPPPGPACTPGLQARQPLGGSLPVAFHAQEPCYRTCLKSRQDPTF